MTAPNSSHESVPTGIAERVAATSMVTSHDFVEHTHRDFGPGYFCTPDVMAKIDAATAMNADLLVALRNIWAASNSYYIRRTAREAIAKATGAQS
jgi:hypothetical protein